MVETVIGDAEALISRLQQEIGAAAARAQSDRRRWSIAVSGGSVATTFFPGWGSGPADDWAAADVFWADERAVRPDDPDSNYGLARSLWLASGRVPADAVHRMPADDPDLDQAADAYAEDLRCTLGQALAFDVVLLGVGPDGHVASLFPNHPLLDERWKLVAAVVDSPKPPPRRLTLTLPVLTGARLLVIGAFGAAKAGIVRDALENPASRLPAALASRGAARSLWLLDAGAASGLTPR